jgi:hypothetical protein
MAAQIVSSSPEGIIPRRPGVGPSSSFFRTAPDPGPDPTDPDPRGRPGRSRPGPPVRPAGAVRPAKAGTGSDPLVASAALLEGDRPPPAGRAARATGAGRSPRPAG